MVRYAVPGLGKVKRAFVRSQRFDYARAMLSASPQELHMLEDECAHGDGLSDVSLVVTAFAVYAVPGRDGTEDVQDVYYVSVNVAYNDPSLPTTEGRVSFPLPCIDVLIKPYDAPVMHAPVPAPAVHAAPVAPAAAAAAPALPGNVLTAMVTPTPIVLSKPFDPTMMPHAPVRAAFARELTSKHWTGQPDPDRVSQLLDNVSPGMKKQLVADGALTMGVDAVFDHLERRFPCIRTKSDLIHEIFSRRCTDSTNVRDSTGAMLADYVDANGFTDLAAFDASLSAEQRRVTYPDVAAALIKSLPPADRPAFARDGRRIARACTTLGPLHELRFDINDVYDARLSASSKVRSALGKAPKSTDKLLKTIESLQAELKAAKQKKQGRGKKAKGGDNPFPSGMPNCKHCKGDPLEVDGYPGKGRHWHAKCPKNPANAPKVEDVTEAEQDSGSGSDSD